jgi:hypothetical protein
LLHNVKGKLLLHIVITLLLRTTTNTMYAGEASFQLCS